MVAQVMNVCAKAAVHGRCNLAILQQVLQYTRSFDPPVEHNVFSYTSMIDALSKAVLMRKANLADVDTAWQMMLDDGVSPNCKTYSALLTVYANSAVSERRPTIELALQKWNEMLDNKKLYPATGTYNALVNCMAKNAAVGVVSIEEARALMLSALEKGVFWNEQTLVSYLELLQRVAIRRPSPSTDPEIARRALKEGWWVIERAEQAGVVVGARTFSGLTALVAKAASVGHASRQDLNDVLEAMEKRGVMPDSTTYVSRMEALAKLTTKGQASIKDGVALLQEMRSKKVEPTTELFNVLMDICAKAAISGAGQPQDGFGILQWMSSFSIEPDRTTYNTLLNLLAQSARFGKARARHGLSVLERMRQQGISVDRYTVGSFVNLAKTDASISAVQLARQVFDAAPARERNQRVYALMIAAEARVGSGRVCAEELLEQARAQGVKPNTYMLNAALQACGTADELLELRSRLQNVAADDITNRLMDRASKGQAPVSFPPKRDDPQLEETPGYATFARKRSMNL